MAQRRYKRTMSAHGVTEDAACVICGKVRFDQGGQLVGHIVLHAVMLSPRGLCGVDIKASTLPQVVSRIVGHVFTARTGVWRHHNETMPRRMRLRACFGDEVLLCAGQT